MKALWKICLLALLVLALSIIACDKDDDDNNNDLTGPGDVTPANTDWQIIFIHNPNVGKLETYSMTATWLGNPTAINQSDTFSMKIDGTEYTVSSYWVFGVMMIWAEAQLNPGHTYNFEFYRNGTKVCDVDIKMPYPATATFPQNYSPTASATFNWSLSDNNQYQFAGVSAYGGADQTEDAIVSITPSARSYTVPANAVTGFGPSTEYELLVTQINFARDGRTAVSAIQGQYKDYNTQSRDASQNLLRIAKKLSGSLAR